MERRIVCVAGMHRSGTSMVTRLLPFLGVELGSEFPPAGPDNPKGYWENIELRDINERLLARFNLDWYSTRKPSLDGSVQPEAADLHQEATDLLVRIFGDVPVCGFKDPRTPRFLPFWQEVFRSVGRTDSYIITVRNPISVARSLEERNNFSQEHGVLLWLEHMVCAITHSAGKARVAVDYDLLLSDPLTQALRICRVLSLPEPDAHQVEELMEWIDPHLRHHQDTGPAEVCLGDDLDSSALYALLQSAARDQLSLDDPSVTSFLSRSLSALQVSEKLLEVIDSEHARFVHAHEEASHAREQALTEREQAKEQTEREHSEAEQNAAQLQAALEAREQEVTEVRHLAQTSQDRYDLLEQQTAQLQAALEAREQEVTEVRHLAQISQDRYERVALQLATIVSGTSWRLLRLLWVIRAVVAPRESTRDKVLRRLIWPVHIAFKVGKKVSSLFGYLRRVHSRLRELWLTKAYTSSPLKTMPIEATETSRVAEYEAVRWVPPIAIGAQYREALFLHPTASVRYRLRIPRRAIFRGFVGLIPEVWGENPDGVLFSLRLRDTRGRSFERTVLVHPTRFEVHRRWNEFLQKLGPWAGQETEIDLSTSLPENGADNAAWAYWGQPAILQRKPLSHLLGRVRQLVQLHGVGGLTKMVRSQLKSVLSDGNTATTGRVDDAAQEIWVLPPPASVLSFPTIEVPLVSVIVPCFNGIPDLHNCANHLLLNTTNPLYEVIFIDDASTEPIWRFFKKAFRNATLLRNETNLGYIRTCNLAAAHARGEFLVFLNQDTGVQAGWLDAMLDVVRADPSVGMVGAKLVYPDGRLQEAGGIIWNDMSAWNFGRGDDREKPEYNYVREVDYCSGACVLIPRDIFNELGGFDEQLAPAYGDDADFAMKLRVIGRRVVYQPRALVVHIEGATMGTSVTDGLKVFQEVNKLKLQTKWAEELTQHHFPNGQDLFLARERHTGPRILFIDHYVPTWDRDAGSLRMYEYIKIFLHLGAKVVLWPANLHRLDPYTSDLQQMGVEVLYGPMDFGNYMKENGPYFDLVYGCRSSVIKDYIDAIVHSGVPFVYDPHDLSYLREARRANIEGSKAVLREADRLRKLEHHIIKLCDGVVLLSSHEAELIARAFPEKRVFLQGTVHEVRESQRTFDDRQGLLFVGGFAHQPNLDAVKWFIRDVMPVIRKDIPDITLDIIGSSLPVELREKPVTGVRLLGYVDDLYPHFQASRVFIAPLRYGAGQKGKIAQSLGYGLPVVTTTVGAEGMPLEDGVSVLVADEPAAFASAVVRLYGDGRLWEGLSQRGLEICKTYYSRDTMTTKLRDMLVELGVKCQGG